MQQPQQFPQIQTLIFEISTPKSIFGQTWAQKIKVACFVLKLVHKVSQDADSKSRLRFLKFQPQNQFLGKFGPKKFGISEN